MKINIARREELKDKFNQMGEALLKEGDKLQDYTILQAGSIFQILAETITSDEDMFMFSEVCGMYAAKKFVDSLPTINPASVKTAPAKQAPKKQAPKKKAPVKKAAVKKPRKGGDKK